jgi:hypothetical protein
VEGKGGGVRKGTVGSWLARVSSRAGGAWLCLELPDGSLVDALLLKQLVLDLVDRRLHLLLVLGHHLVLRLDELVGLLVLLLDFCHHPLGAPSKKGIMGQARAKRNDGVHAKHRDNHTEIYRKEDRESNRDTETHTTRHETTPHHTTPHEFSPSPQAASG